MPLNLSAPQFDELKPRITVFGVGGAGGNAVNNMIEQQLQGVEFVVANTDAQALAQSAAEKKVQMGVKVTEGLGAGARPQIGADAAEESIEDIVDHLAGAHMCFITAGMGGGTGTGATPIIAQAARELGVLTVGVVTKPFQFEGSRRMRQAEEGIEKLQKMVDTLIIIPNQNLFIVANEQTTCKQAFAMADDVLYQGVKGVTDLMVRPGLINLDFADIRAVMDEMGKAMMGTGEAEGERRAVHAAEQAINNPLLDEISLNGARGVLINVTGGADLTLYELDEAANVIREKVDADANIIVGSTLDDTMDGTMRVSVVATGIDAAEERSDLPVPRRRLDATSTQSIEAPAEESFHEDARTVAEAPAEMAEHHDPAQESARGAEDDSFAVWHERRRAEREMHDHAPRSEAPAREEAPAARPAPAGARRNAGQPTPEALDRLEKAVRNVPQSGGGQRGAAPAGGEKGRFGINTLINRMTGAPEGAAPQAPKAPERPMPAASAMTARRPLVAAPRPVAEPEDMSSDQDRIEIPAFLRRQAN